MKKTGTGGITRALWLLATVLLVAMLALLAGACGDKDTTGTTAGGSQPTGDPVVIGAIVSATGANSALGAPERNVLEMMEGYINGAGGVLGRPLEIIIEDDKSDSAAAVTAANLLIEQKKVVALIAATGSASTMAVKGITAEKGLPQMAMVAATRLTDEPPMEWIWRTPQKNTTVVERTLTYVSDTLKASQDSGTLRRECLWRVWLQRNRQDRERSQSGNRGQSSRTRPTTLISPHNSPVLEARVPKS